MVSLLGDVIQLALAIDCGLDSYKVWMRLSSSLVSSACSSLWAHGCLVQEDLAQLQGDDAGEVLCTGCHRARAAQMVALDQEEAWPSWRQVLAGAISVKITTSTIY